MKRIPLFAAASLALAASACGPTAPEAGSIDLTAHRASTGSSTWRGLSVHNERLHLVAEGRGIVELALDGTLVGERKVGEGGLLDAPYRDVAALDAAYVLLADDQGFLYDPQAESETVHFCVLPGDFVGPAQKQKNDAVAVDVDTIYANPRFYDLDDSGTETGLATSELRTYRLSDGVPSGVVPLERPLELHGLAVVDGALLGVQGDRVYRIERDGSITSETAVEGLEVAAGIATDATRAFILDATNERIAIVALDDLE